MGDPSRLEARLFPSPRYVKSVLHLRRSDLLSTVRTEVDPGKGRKGYSGIEVFLAFF